MELNPYETDRRLVKVVKLTNALIRCCPVADGELPQSKYLVAAAANFDDQDWALAASVAGVRPPSQRTQEQVVMVLATLANLEHSPAEVSST